MKHVIYNSNRDLNSLIEYARGKYELKFFILFFMTSLFVFSNLPLDIIVEENKTFVNIICSSFISLIGGCAIKEANRKNAKNQLSKISMSLEENDVYILEEDLEKAVVSSINTIEDRFNKFDEVVNYFLVLDREKQIKILESIKIDLSFGGRRFMDYSLYVLDKEDTNDLVIPSEEIAKLRLGGNYGKIKL